MKTLIFATGNAGKVTSPKRVLAGYGIELIQRAPEPELVEIQADGAAEVAVSKARQAFERFRAPVMVIDSAFHIPALNGFPGIYVKHVTERIGPEGYFKLLRDERGWRDPSCYFEDVIAYFDGKLKEPVTFSRQEWGNIIPKAQGPDVAKAKSALWKVWMPKGYAFTLAHMPPDMLAEYRARPEQERFYHEFAEWLHCHALTP